MAAKESAEPPRLRIKGYRFESAIAKGGFSRVMLYEDTDLGDLCAVKVFNEKVPWGKRRSRVDESLTMVDIKYSNIARVRARGVAQGYPYIVFDYYPSTLAEAVGLSSQRVTEIGLMLASALGEVHRKHIIHSDIKPANVLLNDQGEPYLSDFGGAVFAREGGSETTQAARMPTDKPGLVHSRPWAAPEQFEREYPSTATDVFGLCATLYTLLEGHGPWIDPLGVNDPDSMRNRALRGRPVPFANTPPALRAVLEDGLERTPARRIQTARELWERLASTRGPSESREDFRKPKPEPEPEPVTEPVTATDVAPVLATTVTGWPDRPAPAPVETTDPTSIHDADTVGVRIEPIPVVAPGEPARRRPARVVALVATAVVAVVTVSVVAGILSQPTPTVDPDDAVSAGPSDAFPDTVPTPELVSVSRSEDGTSVTFLWANPRGAEGDTYIWTRTDGPNDAPAIPTADTSATIGPVGAGEKVCIEVLVRRQGGRTSADPLGACTA